MVYSKVLRVGICRLDEESPLEGNIANLMSEDVVNVFTCVSIGHYVWAIPLKVYWNLISTELYLCVEFYLIYQLVNNYDVDVYMFKINIVQLDIDLLFVLKLIHCGYSIYLEHEDLLIVY